jgi:hypothetical protein
MNILIYTAIHKRPEITELFLLGIERLKEYSGHNIELFCVCSTQDDKKLLKEHGVEYCVYPNDSLADKLDYGFKQAIKKDFDYLMGLGSDNLIDHELFEKHYDKLMRSNVDCFGLKSFGVVNSYTLETSIFHYFHEDNHKRLVGAGRMMSRHLCNKFVDKPFYNRNSFSKGADRASENEILKHTDIKCIFSPEIYVLDIKSQTNIWSYNDLLPKTIPADFKKITHFTSVQEDEYLINLISRDARPLKIILVTGIWKRHEIFRRFAENVSQLGIHVIVSGSEGEVSKNLVESYGFEYIEMPNTPLSVKMNAPVLRAKELGADYVLFTGSDDLISKECFDVYKEHARKRIDFIGLLDFYFYDTNTDKTLYWEGYSDHRKGHTVGAYRMISSRLLDRMDWQPFELKDSAVLDNSMQKKLKVLPHTITTFKLKDKRVYAIDIKSDVNMTPFRQWPNSEFIKGDKLKTIFNLCAVSQ